MCNVRLFLAVLLLAVVTYSQTDSFYVVPSAPTYKDSLSLVIVVHDVSCCTGFTHDSTLASSAPLGGPSSSIIDLSYRVGSVQVLCPQCGYSLHNESLVFRSGPLGPGNYTVVEVTGNLGWPGITTSTTIGSFNVSGPMNITNRLPVKNTLRKSMSAAVYNVRGELISRPTNQYLHGICIVKTGDGTKKTFR